MILTRFLSRFKLGLSALFALTIITIWFTRFYVFRNNRRNSSSDDEDIDEHMWNILTFHHEAKELSPDTIKAIIEVYNSKETIYNEDIFGPVTQETVVLVIQAQKLTMLFRLLLATLSNVRGIDNALLIISQSYVDEEMNMFVRRLGFCKVLQIYYPFPIQAYPNEFPGFSQNDCPTNMDVEHALAVNCSGAPNPDIHGKYRQPAKAELKHHWWWTANKVFGDIKHLRGYTGPIVFLETDFFVTEDFLYMLLFITKTCEEVTICDFISFSEPPMYLFDRSSARGIEVTTWHPTKHSGVLAFNRYIWYSIASHYDKFCTFDDYSWAKSLLFVSLNREDGLRYKVASTVLPRAYRISRFANEYIATDDIIEALYAMLYFQKGFEALLFPAYLEYVVNIELDDDVEVILDYVDMGGGWSDPRDKKLCFDMTGNKIRKVIRDLAEVFKVSYFTGWPTPESAKEL